MATTYEHAGGTFTTAAPFIDPPTEFTRARLSCSCGSSAYIGYAEYIDCPGCGAKWTAVTSFPDDARAPVALRAREDSVANYRICTIDENGNRVKQIAGPPQEYAEPPPPCCKQFDIYGDSHSLGCANRPMKRLRICELMGSAVADTPAFTPPDTRPTYNQSDDAQRLCADDGFAVWGDWRERC